jgi:hypothetical protein
MTARTKFGLKFGDEDILVDSEPSDDVLKPYNSWEEPGNLHFGQLKLGLVEEYFYLRLAELGIHNPIVVYAAAAAGYHIPFSSRMHPDFDFYLYDPGKFGIKESSRIRIFNTYFTDDTAKKWAKETQTSRPMVFMSDVRSGGVDHEEEVKNNMLMQARWVQIMAENPNFKLFMLKFRIPFPIVELGAAYRYFDGDLIYQPYAPSTSMELRLILGNEDARRGLVREYDSKTLEQQLFYHNTVIRPNKQLYANVFTENPEPYLDDEFDNGYDSTYFLHIISEYIHHNSDFKTPDERTGLDLAKRMVREITGGRRSLRKVI